MAVSVGIELPAPRSVSLESASFRLSFPRRILAALSLAFDRLRGWTTWQNV